MRRLGTKNKRKKSEIVSDSESEENGVTRTATDDKDELKKSSNQQDNTEPSPMEKGSRKSLAKKRPSRGRAILKALPGEEEGIEGNESDGREENGSVGGRGGAGKRRKKEEHKATTSANEESADNNEEYEVEKIIGRRTIKGRRQFLVRWKGYDETSDTWEHEKDLNCVKLMEKYLAEEEENKEDEEAPEVPAKMAKTKSFKKETKKSKRSKGVKSQDEEEGENDEEEDQDGREGKQKKDGKDKKVEKDKKIEKDEKDDGQKEFEVEKIIEVRFKKNKTKEFLIRWKGFSSADDTWEPEQNLNCPDLIEKFMQKVEKARATDMRELRTNRPHTKRYTVATPEIGRRLSRRNIDKQRATYHECDE